MKILPARVKSDLLPFNTLALSFFSMLSYLTFKNYTNIQMRTFLFPCCCIAGENEGRNGRYCFCGDFAPINSADKIQFKQ